MAASKSVDMWINRVAWIGWLLSGAMLLAQNVGSQDRSRTRGKTPTQTPQETVNRGRIGQQAAIPYGPQKFYGILVDAGCPERDAMTLQLRPVSPVAPAPPTAGAKGAAAPANGGNGINVSQQVLAAERGRVTWMETPDHLTRQMDPACGISGATKAFALFMPQGTWGKLVNLDEGGNTYAYEAFQATPQGQAILSGTGQPMKPVATVTGFRRGDKIIVSSVQLQSPAVTAKLGNGAGTPRQTAPPPHR